MPNMRLQIRSREDVLSLAKGEKIPLGLPVDNNRAYILDENLNPVEDGQRGSLYVAGAHLCGGFVTSGAGIAGVAAAPDPFLENRFEEENLGNFPRLIRMGDVCVNLGGKLYYEGRLDSQVNKVFD
jgi:non-ribosomal peptide synthetase component F